MLPQNAFKKSLWLAPGVAGAIVPCVCRALFIVKLHPGDQVQEPEISNFITWRYWRRFELCNYLGSPCLGFARLWEARQQGRRITETTKPTFTIMLKKRQPHIYYCNKPWPPHPMFLFFVGNCIYTYKGLSISFLELKPNLKSDSFVVNFSS